MDPVFSSFPLAPNFFLSLKKKKKKKKKKKGLELVELEADDMSHEEGH